MIYYVANLARYVLVEHEDKDVAQQIGEKELGTPARTVREATPAEITLVAWAQRDTRSLAFFNMGISAFHRGMAENSCPVDSPTAQEEFRRGWNKAKATKEQFASIVKGGVKKMYVVEVYCKLTGNVLASKDFKSVEQAMDWGETEANKYGNEANYRVFPK